MFSLEQFVSENVTKRQSSMFYSDIAANKDALMSEIVGRSIINCLNSLKGEYQRK